MSIGQTVIKLSTVLEHVIRRVGLPAESQTPEFIQLAKNNLFFIFSNLTNRGVDLWAIDEQSLSFVPGAIRMTLPDGTVDVLNTNYRKNTLITGTDSSTSTEYIREFDESSSVISFRLNSSFVGTVTVSSSSDGISYNTNSTITHDGTEKWYHLDTKISNSFLKLSITSGILTVTELITVTSYTDTPMYRMNRDDYSNLPNKYFSGKPLNFWLDRQLDPVVNLWPIPSTDHQYDCFSFYRQHQIEDVGTLDQNLTIPNRWLEAIIWQLAKNVSIELPNVQADRIQMAIQMADRSTLEAEMDERDNSPVFISPNISVYTS